MDTHDVASQHSSAPMLRRKSPDTRTLSWFTRDAVNGPTTAGTMIEVLTPAQLGTKLPDPNRDAVAEVPDTAAPLNWQVTALPFCEHEELSTDPTLEVIADS